MLSRLVLEPNQPSTEGLPGALSQGVKRAGREPGHSPPTIVEVTNMLIYTSTPPYSFMV
jgi:hypothetical protein